MDESHLILLRTLMFDLYIFLLMKVSLWFGSEIVKFSLPLRLGLPFPSLNWLFLLQPGFERRGSTNLLISSVAVVYTTFID